MRFLGTALPSKMLATRFCTLSTPVSSKAKEEKRKKKEVEGLIESMMSSRKLKKNLLRRMSVFSELKFGFLRRGVRNRFEKAPAKVMLVS